MNIGSKLKEELNWLLKKYPLKNLKVEMFYYDSKQDDYPYNESAIGDKMYEKNNEVCIVIGYNEGNQYTETDIITLRNLKSKNHLPYWYLYHEYGHLIELNKMIDEKGFEEASKWLESLAKEIDKTINESINFYVDYKLLVSEKNADLFANKIYMNRLKELEGF